MNIGEITHALKRVDYDRHGLMNSTSKRQKRKQEVLNREGDGQSMGM